MMTKSERPEVDPRNWARFARDALPRYLTSAGVGIDQATAAATDVYARGCALSQLDDGERLRLSMPFFEETYFYEPAGASDLLKARVALAVRSSAIEPLHVQGLLEAHDISQITSLATTPLSHLTGAVREGRFQPELSDAALTTLASWRSIPGRYPRAWDALGALATLARTGAAREPLRRRGGDPAPLDIHEGTGWVNAAGAVVLDAMQEAFDPETARMMREWAQPPPAVVVVASLSRFTRNVVKLAATLDWLLGYRVQVLTTNHLLRQDAVYTRRHIIALEPRERVLPTNIDGLSGLHRKTYEHQLRVLRDAKG